MELLKGHSSSSMAAAAPKICVVNVPYGQHNGGGGTVASSVQAAAVTTPSTATTNALSLLPTVPVPQQTHIAVAAAPTAPANLGKMRY